MKFMILEWISIFMVTLYSLHPHLLSILIEFFSPTVPPPPSFDFLKLFPWNQSKNNITDKSLDCLVNHSLRYRINVENISISPVWVLCWYWLSLWNMLGLFLKGPPHRLWWSHVRYLLRMGSACHLCLSADQFCSACSLLELVLKALLF